MRFAREKKDRCGAWALMRVGVVSHHRIIALSHHRIMPYRPQYSRSHSRSHNRSHSHIHIPTASGAEHR